MLLLDIKVFPQSGRQAWVVDENSMIKCYLKSAPEGGKANKELLLLLSKLLGIPQYHLRITQGLTTRLKRVNIPLNIDKETIIDLINKQK